MNLTEEQKYQLSRLIDYRDQISGSMFHIERILKTYFPEEFSMAYQHWIPQINTAIENHPKWLSRGQFNMQDTLNKLTDSGQDSDNKGVSKFI